METRQTDQTQANVFDPCVLQNALLRLSSQGGWNMMADCILPSHMLWTPSPTCLGGAVQIMLSKRIQLLRLVTEDCDGSWY